MHAQHTIQRHWTTLRIAGSLLGLLLVGVVLLGATVAFAAEEGLQKANNERAGIEKAENPAIAQRATEFELYLRPALASELILIQQTCKLEHQHRATVKAAGEQGVKRAALAYAQWNFAQDEAKRHGVKAPAPVDPRGIIQQDLAKALQQILTAEQMNRYNEEINSRTEQRQRAAILYGVGRLDERLSLSPGQRTKIAEELKSHWNDAWYEWLWIPWQSHPCIPMISDQILVPHLDEGQTAAWRKLHKVDLKIRFRQGPQVLKAFDEAWWNDTPEAESPPTE